MRLKTLEVQGFRAFAGEVRFDLDADVIIVAGANGQGKTSLFDAIMWAIVGVVPRLGLEAKNLTSMYSTSGQTRVRVLLRSPRGEDIQVTRSLSDGTEKTTVQVGDDARHGAAAVSLLMEEMWPDALLTQDNTKALVSAFTNSVYLQQDLVRAFVEADDERERFGAVGELVGAGRISELHIELDKQKRAWASASNQMAKDREATSRRRLALEDQFRKLAHPEGGSPAEKEENWASWWQAATDLLSQKQTFPAFDSSDTSSTLDRTVRELQRLRYQVGQRRELLTQLLGRMEKHDWEGKRLNEADLTEKLDETRRLLTDARKRLADAQKAAAETRRRLTEAREAAEELRALSKLALRHLGEHCPVCGQEYDRAQTEQRLRGRFSENAESPEDKGEGTDVGALAAQVEEHERKELALEHAQRDARDRAQIIGELDSAGIQIAEGADPRAEVRALVDEYAKQSERLASLLSRAEALSLVLARASEEARRVEIEHQLAELAAVIKQQTVEIASREETSELAARTLDALREASSDVVGLKLEEVESLLQRIYATINPHPSFRVVRLLTRTAYGRGRLFTVIRDPREDVETEHPDRVLSNSQLNALAVSIFLALNLAIPRPPLDAVILDDPIQSLDDVNLLGLVDLLRRAKNRRQLFISTHDHRFGRLLERKLRPVSSAERTRVIRFTGWGREGPTVEAYDVDRQVGSLRIVG